MDRVYWVWLLQVMGPHNPKSAELYLKHKSITKIYELINSEKIELTPAEKRRLGKYKLSDAEKIVNWCDKCGVKIVTIDSDDYPARLSSVYNPPILLFCLGNISFVDDEVTVAVVGTRKPNEYSATVAKQICYNLSKLGIVIVSGFAMGIDSVAHGCALQAKGRTIAVLGCGIDYNYPKENAKMKKIIAKNGAVVSEYLPGTPPKAENFPERNRIISGLSLGTLVVEADVTSGSLITAELSLQQGREVFCVPPHNIFDRRFSGVIKYLRDGAIPVFSHLDIVYTYFDEIVEKINPENPYADYSLEAENEVSFNSKEEKPKAKKSAKKQDTEKQDEPEEQKEKPEIDLDLFDDVQRKIIVALQSGDKIPDQICNCTGLPIGDVLAALTELEILGTIKLARGQIFTLN